MDVASCDHLELHVIGILTTLRLSGIGDEKKTEPKSMPSPHQKASYIPLWLEQKLKCAKICKLTIIPGTQRVTGDSFSVKAKRLLEKLPALQLVWTRVTKHVDPVPTICCFGWNAKWKLFFYVNIFLQALYSIFRH